MTFQVRQHNMSLNFSGFRVGTKLGGQNVISDFDIVADWASKSDSMASQTMTDVGMDFFLESAESITLIAANVISEPDGLMKAKLDGMVVRNLISHGNVVLEPGISYHVRIASTEFEEHLSREESTMVPLLMDCFSLRELWAIDSFIINPKLDYCDKATLIKITKWWFSNISIKEGWPLLKNFIKAGKQAPMPLEEWKKLQDMVPALLKFPTKDLIS